jgi:hypothetical protein
VIIWIKKKILVLVFCVAVISTYSQTTFKITGVIKDSLTSKGLADVIIICTIESTQYYSISDSIGNFNVSCSISDSLNKVKVFFIAKLIGYVDKADFFLISNSQANLPPILLQSKAIYLSEVIVQNKSVVQKGDTTIFMVGAFKNKLDANLEDVLKKMPGMDVDENGNIRYNNKPIENIMIEGDELSKNYKLISKNITPDMVDKVEMIDKYNSNPVLKDLTNSQKQTMNLVLKNPKKLKKFGTVKLGAGVPNKINVTGSLFVLNNKIKTMSILNKNNIGQSPYGEYSVDQNFAQTAEYEFSPTILPNYITENSLFAQSFFGNNVNSLFNKSNLGVINSSIKLNKSMGIKLFTDAYSDKINQYQQVISKNNLFPALSYNENSTKRFLPVNFNNNAEFKWNTHKSQLLISGSYISKKYTEQSDVLSFINFNSLLNSTYKRLSAGLYYTHRVDSLKAFELSYQFIGDKKTQLFTSLQNQYRFLDTTYLTNYQAQQTCNAINSHTAEIKYLFKKKRTNQVSIKNTYFNSLYNANLNAKDNNGNNFTVPNYADTTSIINNDVVLSYNTGYIYKKLSIIADMGVLLNSYSGTSGTTAKKSNSQLYAIPRLNLSYKINSEQRISANISWDVDNPVLSNRNVNPLLISYRTIKRNSSIAPPVQNLKYGVNYSYTNFNKATSFLVSYYHVTQSQSEIRNYTFTRDFDYFKLRYEDVPQKIDNIYFKFDRYFYPLKTAIGLKQSLVWFNNPTEVKGAITSNKFFTYNANLSIRPTIGDNINFNMGAEYKYNKDLSAVNSTFQLNPYVDILFTAGKKISLGGRCNYFYTNYDIKKRNYIFANLYSWYTIKPKKLDAKLSIFNLLDTNASLFGTVTTAITKSVTTQLLPRYALLEFVFKF